MELYAQSIDSPYALLTLNLLLDTKSFNGSGLQHRRQSLLVAKSSSHWVASTNVGGCLSMFYIWEAVLAIYPAAEFMPFQQSLGQRLVH